MKVFVAGAGNMGAGIAQAFAECGDQVFLYDTIEAAVQSGVKRIKHGLELQIDTGRFTETEAQLIASRIVPTLEITPVSEVDVVIEAVFENAEVKQNLFQDLEALARPDAILATNTNSLSITEIASSLDHPERVVGIHFFNPPARRAVVEVVHTLLTAPEALDRALELAAHLGKRAIVTADYSGFIVNRLVMPQINQAAYLVMQQLAKADEIDEALILTGNHCEGPLHQADRIGIDTVLEILEHLYEASRLEEFRPCPLFARMVQAGHLGRKTGQGFFTYSGKEKEADA